MTIDGLRERNLTRLKPLPIVARLAAAAALFLAWAAGPGAGAAAATVTAIVSSGTLQVTSDAAADPIGVTCSSNDVLVNGTEPAPPAACSSIAQISIDAGDGDD